MRQVSNKRKTDAFIDKYMVEGGTGKGFGLYKMVAESKGADKTKVASVIRKMDYLDFMKTRYWQLVAQQVKHNAGWRCEHCGSKHDLVAHHVGYRLHGYEMYHVAELKCLCQACHERLHGLRA